MWAGAKVVGPGSVLLAGTSPGCASASNSAMLVLGIKSSSCGPEVVELYSIVVFMLFWSRDAVVDGSVHKSDTKLGRLLLRGSWDSCRVLRFCVFDRLLARRTGDWRLRRGPTVCVWRCGAGVLRADNPLPHTAEELGP